MTMLHRKKLLFIFSSLILVLTSCDTGFGRSANTSLATLSITESICTTDSLDIGLSPSFSEDERDYSSEVSQPVETVAVSASAEDSEATIRINGQSVSNSGEVEVSLSEGVNTITIEVTAENERTREYEVEITRSSESAVSTDLASLALDFLELDETFSSTETEYNAAANFFVNTTRVTTEATDSLATVELTSSDLQEVLLDLVPSSEILLSEIDDEVLSIEVNACTGGDETNTYTVGISRTGSSGLAHSVYFKASNTDAGDMFGSAIAAEGNMLIVGAPEEDSNSSGSQGDGANAAGAVYAYLFDGTNWSQIDYVKPSTVTEGENFGSSVALYGDLLVVGAPGFNNSQGRVLYFEYDAVNTEWDYGDAISADFPQNDAEFGASVATNGEYIVVGAPGESTNQGKVYVFERNGSDWDLQEREGNELLGQTASRFGEVIDFNLSSETPEFIVGASDEFTSTGGAYVYQFDDGDDEWVAVQLASLFNDDESLGTEDRFGEAVAINGNRLVVGAPGDDSNQTNVSDDIETDNDGLNSGAAYVFEREDEDDDWEFVQFLKASQVSDMAFGSSVALSANIVAVGAPLEDGDQSGVNADDGDTGNEFNSGAVYAFEAQESLDADTVWTSAVYAKSANSEEGDQFGSAMAFYGEYLFVASPNEDSNAEDVSSTPIENDANPESGAVYLIQ